MASITYFPSWSVELSNICSLRVARLRLREIVPATDQEGGNISHGAGRDLLSDETDVRPLYDVKDSI